MSQASNKANGKAREAAGPGNDPAPSQWVTTYPCPLWGKSFDDFAETSLDSTYRHISPSWFRTLDDLGISMPTTALLIRDEYENLYKLICKEAPPIMVRGAYTGVAVIGQPGIGQLQLHCISPEGLTVMLRQVVVSELCAPSPLEHRKTHCVSNCCGRHLDFQ